MIRIFGKNCIHEAIRAEHSLDTVYIEELQAKKDPGFVQMLKDKKIKYEIVAKKVMDSKFPTNHQGYGAMGKDYPYSDLVDVINQNKGKRSVILVLDGIEDPHNFGAMIRSCDAFSIAGIVIPKNRSVSITDTVAHVSTGAIEYVPIIMVNNLVQALRTMKENGYWVVGTDAYATQEAKDIDKSLNLAVIIGSEGFGMSKVCKKECDYEIKIPMTGHVNSLNASVSCGIILSSLV